MNIPISDMILKKFPSFKILEIEGFQEEYKKRQYCSIESKTKGKDFARNVCMLLLCTLNRSFSLYRGAINSLNNSDAIVALLASRAHMESTGVVAYLQIQLQKYYKMEISFDEIDNNVMKLHLGRRSYMDNTEPPHKIDTINVMTLIDSVDKVFFKPMEDKVKHRKIFRNSYEWLSEYCHPNFFGQTLGVVRDGSKCIFDYNPSLEESEVNEFCLSLCMSCDSLFAMYDECFSLISGHEKMPELLKS